MTLEELLLSRDRRAAMQSCLRSLYPDLTIVVLTVVMPGEEKQTRCAAIIAEAALSAIVDAFGDTVRFRLIRDLATGYEAYFAINASSERAKEIAMQIEESHPLGRLMDIDVIGEDGKPISRNYLRKCLLCGRPARECMRAAKHSREDLLNHINSLCEEYVRGI